MARRSRTRRLAIAASLTALVMLAVWPSADARPGRGRGPKPTTTVASPPTETTDPDPAPTTVAPTITTTPSTTTAGGEGGACGGPVTITAGGVYSGCYESTDAAVPAVSIATTAPVVIDRASVRHKGRGIKWAVTGAQVSVTDSTLTALDNGGNTSIEQTAIELYKPVSVVLEHNLFTDGGGIYVQADLLTVPTLRIRFNDVVNVARYGSSAPEVSAVEFNKVVSQADIGWNRVRNDAGSSAVLDTIELYESSGLDAAHPIDVHDNMVRGAYAWTGDGGDYVGGGIMGGDNGGGYQTIRDNRVVGTSNYGVSIPGGHDITATGNRLVNDGKTEAGTPHGPGYATGAVVWNANRAYPTGPNTAAHDNVIGWVKPDGSRGDTWFPACDPAGACSANTIRPDPITGQTELDEWTAWAGDLAAAGLTVGPTGPA